MKKLLVLALVLGMATLAQAALVSTSTDTAGVVLTVVGNVVSVDGTATENFNLVVISDLALSPLDASALGAAAPSMADLMAGFGDLVAGCLTDLTGYTSGAVWTITKTPTEVFATGNYLTLDAVAGATITVALFNEGTGELEQIQTIVPEPITMALLGLGGLFLRRRSK